MILVNRNFGNPVLAEVIGDMFRASSDEGQKVDAFQITNNIAPNSSLVSQLSSSTSFDTNYNTKCNNFYIVTEQFLKTLDKVYTKIWNESFTETGIYTPSNLATIFHGFAISGELTSSRGVIMIFKRFVDRCITAGILDEADRLQYEDQIFLSGMVRTNMSTQINLDNKLITLTNSTPIDITPDIDAQAGQYLNGKKLYLLMTPYLTNQSVIKMSDVSLHEPFLNRVGSGGSFAYVKRPIAFFKPKTDASKFGRSLPLATHLIWSIGTPDDKELALLEGKPVPDLIFDHLDRISHIDNLTLKIKFDKLQF